MAMSDRLRRSPHGPKRTTDATRVPDVEPQVTDRQQAEILRDHYTKPGTLGACATGEQQPTVSRVSYGTGQPPHRRRRFRIARRQWGPCFYRDFVPRPDTCPETSLVDTSYIAVEAYAARAVASCLRVGSVLAPRQATQRERRCPQPRWIWRLRQFTGTAGIAETMQQPPERSTGCATHRCW